MSYSPAQAVATGLPYLVPGQLADLPVQSCRITIGHFVNPLALVAGDHAPDLLVNAMFTAQGDEAVSPPVVRLHLRIGHNLADELADPVLDRLPGSSPSTFLCGVMNR